MCADRSRYCAARRRSRIPLGDRLHRTENYAYVSSRCLAVAAFVFVCETPPGRRYACGYVLSLASSACTGGSLPECSAKIFPVSRAEARRSPGKAYAVKLFSKVREGYCGNTRVKRSTEKPCARRG